ncbi:MAG: terminase [Clostridia bacterium]|nr:terminase [Clostridia bacterium]MBR3428498.1 terminase [Clostridia bacterium]
MEVRKGRQTPTVYVILPYEETLGEEAIKLYESTKRTAQEWQKLLIYDIMARTPDKLWTHSKFGYSVPRRNGKNEVVSIREMWGLQQGEHILHTAHRSTTSRAAWERLKTLLDDAGIAHKDSGVLGQETIRIKETGGVIHFRTRTSKGGLGEGFDLLIIDEAQEYTDDQETSLKYVVTASQNPQTIFCGTPPTTESSGMVFMHMREAILSEGIDDTGWAEWSVEETHKQTDIDAWYETNPSLGTILTERAIKQEIGPNEMDFNIQRLGYWIRYNLKSAVSRAEWDELQCKKLPELRSKIFVGVKYSRTDTVAVSIAIRTEDNRIFVEGIDCRHFRAGTDWIVSFLHSIDYKAVVIDGQSGQQLLKDAMKDAHLYQATLPKVADVVKANATFEERLAAKELCHMGQPSMICSVTNCEKRAIGTNGGFGYRSINEAYDIALMESMILAQWICGQKTKRSAKRQKISY